MKTLDDRGLLDACHDGDLDACRELTARHAPSALRAAYLLTGSRSWSVELVSGAMVDLLGRLRRGMAIDRFEHALLLEIVNCWTNRDRDARDSGGGQAVDEQQPATITNEPVVRRTREALARLDDHQRAAIALHVFAGLPVEDLAGALELSPELVYVQITDSRSRLMEAVDLKSSSDLATALNAVALNAPRIAIWPQIEHQVRQRFEREKRRQRRLSIGVAAAVCAVLTLGVLFVSWRGDGTAPPATATVVEAAAAPTTGTVFSVAPTATATPAANVGDTIVFSSRSSEARQSWLFEERLEDLPLLGENTLEAGSPVVAPDGRQVFLLWYAYENGGATAFVGAFDEDLSSELWRVAIATDDEAEPNERVDVRMSVAVDHERVYVARQAWQRSDLVEIDVLGREDGVLLETINTNLAGFAAHDIRLHAPPGANQLNLFAITNEAPPETAGLQITYLAYAVPGGEKIHGRILFDLPDSRTFFLYESKLIAGSELLFGIEHTLYYQELAVHLFDLGRGRVEPKRVLPFQPVKEPLPYQQAVSHDGHWLYVLSTAGLEVAVFNLFDQTLAGIVPLDPGVLAGEEIGVSYPQGRSMQISPDGSRIYAEGTLDNSSSGVWVIDAESWTIIDHWAPDLRPAEILLSGDGRTLYARVSSSSGLPSSQGALIAIDTATGVWQSLDMPVADRFSLESIATLFRRTYASSPAIDGQRQESLISSEPLAAARVDLTRTDATPGITVTIDVHFVHPLTGEAVDPQPGGARFEPPNGVRGRWALDDGSSAMILELGRVSYGHYQGFIRLEEPGDWTLEIDVDWPEGGMPDRSLLLEDAVTLRAPVSADGSPQDGSPSG